MHRIAYIGDTDRVLGVVCIAQTLHPYKFYPTNEQFRLSASQMQLKPSSMKVSE